MFPPRSPPGPSELRRERPDRLPNLRPAEWNRQRPTGGTHRVPGSVPAALVRSGQGSGGRWQS